MGQTWGCTALTAAVVTSVFSVSIVPATTFKRAVRDEAEQYLRAGISAYRRGREQFAKEPLEKAKQYLARSVALQPSPEGYFYLGGTLGLLSRPRASTRAYALSVEMDPTVAAAHQNLAQNFDDLGNRSAALTHYRIWSELSPNSAVAKKALAMSLLWSGNVTAGALLCDEAVALAPSDPTIAYDCAQTLVLLLPPEEVLQAEADSASASSSTSDAIDTTARLGIDGSSTHYLTRIEPLFRYAQLEAFKSWPGGPAAISYAPESSRGAVSLCPDGARAIRDWSASSDYGGEKDVIQDISLGGEVYGQRLPRTFGGPFTWAGQRYAERAVRISTLRDVIISGNEGVITRGCDVFVPYYDVQVPWHENLPRPTRVQGAIPEISSALWLLVMFPANFFSFLVDELARLAVWLTAKQERLPLLIPSDRGRLKGFMYDWLTLLGGFDVVPYDIRPHFTGADRLLEPRLRVRALSIVDWRDAPGIERRGDVFLLPPRWALLRLRGLATAWALPAAAAGADADAAASERVLLWIQRATATTRRVANEGEVLRVLNATVQRFKGDRSIPWSVRVFSDVPPFLSAKETVRLFHSANIVVAVHGSGQANQIFCRPGTGIVDINIPEPHSQYSSHNSYALGLHYRLVMLQGYALHQAKNLSLPLDDIAEAVRSLLPLVVA